MDRNLSKKKKEQKNWLKELHLWSLLQLLENPMDRGAWWAAVHGVAEGRI